MSWMNNMRVAYKLLLLNAVALVGMIIIGLVGYFAVMQAQHDLDTISQTYLKGIFEIGRCRHAVRYAQVQTVLAPLTTDQALYQARLDNFNDAVKELDESLALYETIVKDDAQARAQVDAANRDWMKFKAAGEKIFAMRSIAIPPNYQTEIIQPSEITEPKAEKPNAEESEIKNSATETPATVEKKISPTKETVTTEIIEIDNVE